MINLIYNSFFAEMRKIAGAGAPKGHPKWEIFKKNKVPLTPEERALVMKRKATWNHGPKGQATPAVAKAIIDGKTWYETHTHRALNYATTVKGAIKRYHDFIKGTS